MKAPYPEVDLTLTKSELEAPFRNSDPDPEPLPEHTRLFLITEGMFWKAIDPISGKVLEQGLISLEKSDALS